MKECLERIRKPEKGRSLPAMILVTVCLGFAGGLLGVLQKWLDSTPSNLLPNLLQQLDVSNYFGRLAVWILLATIISVSAKTPLRAAINTFTFLVSMIAGYYLYCHFVAGFLPTSYIMLWLGASVVAFILAYAIWYAKGNGLVAILLSALILGVLFSQAILITQGFYVTHLLEVITWLIGVLVLYRKPKEFALEMVLSFGFALLYQLAIPYWG